MKTLLLALFTWGLCTAKTVEYFQFKDSYDGTLVSCAAILPTPYNKEIPYTLIVAEPGDGEKIMNGSTITAVQNLLKKDGQAGFEYLKDTREFPAIMVTFVVPYQPSELTVNGARTVVKGRLLTQVISQAKLRYSTGKLSLTGLSSGGADIWQYISAYPKTVYAAMPMACWQYNQTATINKEVATSGAMIWQVQNSNDGTIGGGSDENLSYFMNELIKMGLKGNMTVLNRSGHDTWIPVYKRTPTAVLVSNSNMNPLSPFPSDVWTFLSGEPADTVINDTIISDTIVIPTPKIICDSLQATVWYSSKSLESGFYKICNYTQNFRVDSISYNWGANGPFGGRKDSVYAKVYGRCKVANSGNYTFSLFTDDGSNLWINDKKVISDYTNHGVREKTATVSLISDTWFKIGIDYYEAGYDASLKAMISGPEVKKQVIKRK